MEKNKTNIRQLQGDKHDPSEVQQWSPCLQNCFCPVSWSCAVKRKDELPSDSALSNLLIFSTGAFVRAISLFNVTAPDQLNTDIPFCSQHKGIWGFDDQNSAPGWSPHLPDLKVTPSIRCPQPRGPGKQAMGCKITNCYSKFYLKAVARFQKWQNSCLFGREGCICTADISWTRGCLADCSEHIWRSWISAHKGVFTVWRLLWPLVYHWSFKRIPSRCLLKTEFDDGWLTRARICIYVTQHLQVLAS